jgi:hypothetical protein
MNLEPDLLRLLKRLKLGQVAPTLPDRLALARAQKLDYAAFLTLIFADEVQRRDGLALERRLLAAGFEERVTLDDFDWTNPIQVDRRHLNELFSLHFLQKKEHVLLIGPVGVGKTFLAQALGAAATRAGHSVLFRRADVLLRELGQARADHSFEEVFRRYLAPDLLVVDDFALHRLTQQQNPYPKTSMRSLSNATVAPVSSSPATATSPNGLGSLPILSSPTRPSTASPTALTSSSSTVPPTAPSSRPGHPRRRLCPDHRHHHRGWLNARGDHWLIPRGD